MFNFRLTFTNFNNSILAGATAIGADLRYCDIKKAVLDGANLSHSRLDMANLSYSSLRATCLKNSNLRRTRLRNADLSNADLSYCDLREANLCGSKLMQTDFANAETTYTNLIDTNASMVDGLTSDQLASARIHPILTPKERVEVTANSFISALLGLIIGVIGGSYPIITSLITIVFFGIIQNPLQAWRELGFVQFFLFLLFFLFIVVWPVVLLIVLGIYGYKKISAKQVSLWSTALRWSKVNVWSLIVTFGLFVSTTGFCAYFGYFDRNTLFLIFLIAGGCCGLVLGALIGWKDSKSQILKDIMS